MKSLHARLVLPLAFALLGACAPAPEKLELVPPPNLHLRARGESARIDVIATGKQGQRLSNPKLRWWSSAPDVVAVSEDGTVVARKSGAAHVTASGGKVAATLDFVVSIPGSMEVRAGNLDNLETGRSVALHAIVKSEDGKPMPDLVPEWRSSNEAVARVEGGMLVGVTPGVATLSAQVGEVRRKLRVQVVRADFARLALEPARTVVERSGKTFKLQARAYDNAGRVIPAPEMHWFSSDVRVVTVSQEGLVTAVGPGHVLISAQAGRRRASADVSVSEPPARPQARR